MGAVCMALEQTALGTGIRYDDIQALNLYWSQVRMLYSCFEANVRASDSSVFDHEMPGGQYTNLMVGVMISQLFPSVLRRFRTVPSFAARPRNTVDRYTSFPSDFSRLDQIIIMLYSSAIKQKYIEANALVS
jgi:Pyruvate carboxylase